MGRQRSIDPRVLLPSKADPEHRKVRKDLEKQAGYGFTEPLVLGMIGVGLLWNMENQVKKCEERKEKQEKEWQEREERRRAKSSRRAPPPSSASASASRRGGENDGRRGASRDGDDDRRRRYHDDDHVDSRRYRPRRYDRDHYYYDYHDDDHYDGERTRGGTPRRQRCYVEDTDGIPRSERRGRSRAAGAGDDDNVSKSEYNDGRSSQYSAAASRYDGSQRIGSQYDDGYEKKRFDGMPAEEYPGDERRSSQPAGPSRRSRRDSY